MSTSLLNHLCLHFSRATPTSTPASVPASAPGTKRAHEDFPHTYPDEFSSGSPQLHGTVGVTLASRGWLQAPRPAGKRTEGKRESKTRSDGIWVLRRVHPASHIHAEFDLSLTVEAPHTPLSVFLSSGLLQSMHDVLGLNVHPTVTPPFYLYRQFLFASKMGSGKSPAYLLPMLHDLKTAEHLSSRTSVTTTHWSACTCRATAFCTCHWILSCLDGTLITPRRSHPDHVGEEACSIMHSRCTRW